MQLVGSWASNPLINPVNHSCECHIRPWPKSSGTTPVGYSSLKFFGNKPEFTVSGSPKRSAELMALLPDSCCSRDLASYWKERERIRFTKPKMVEVSYLQQLTRVTCKMAAWGLKNQHNTYLGICFPPKEHVRRDGFGPCKLLPSFIGFYYWYLALRLSSVGGSAWKRKESTQIFVFTNMVRKATYVPWSHTSEKVAGKPPRAELHIGLVSWTLPN